MNNKMLAGLSFVLLCMPVISNANEPAIWQPVPLNAQLVYLGSNGQDQVQKIIGISDNAVKFRDEAGDEREVVAMQVGIPANQSMTDDDRKKAMELFPLAIGKKTKFKHNGFTRGNRWSVDDTSEVTAIEEIAVPAGKFSTFVIVTNMDNAPYFTAKRIFWYAPEIGYCAKVEYSAMSQSNGPTNTRSELKSITRP